MTEPNFDKEKAILSTDFKEKADYIIQELDKTVFDINEDDLYDYTYKEDSTSKKKRNIKRADVKPVCTATKVSCKLDELFFIFEPIFEPEKLDCNAFIVAFREFMRLMTHINDYVIMTGNKQLYCGFVGITVDDYNNLLTQPFFSTVFKRIDDRLFSSSIVSAESGLLDNKTITSKLEAVDVGHSMRKAEENVVFIQTAKIDKKSIEQNLSKFKNLLNGGNKKQL